MDRLNFLFFSHFFSSIILDWFIHLSRSRYQFEPSLFFLFILFFLIGQSRVWSEIYLFWCKSVRSIPDLTLLFFTLLGLNSVNRIYIHTYIHSYSFSYVLFGLKDVLVFNKKKNLNSIIIYIFFLSFTEMNFSQKKPEPQN